MYVQNVDFLESIGHQLYPQQVSVVIVQLLSNLPLKGALMEDWFPWSEKYILITLYK